MRTFSLFLLGAVLFLGGCATAPPPVDRGMMKASNQIDLHWSLAKLPIVVMTSPDFPAEGLKVLNDEINDLNKKIGTVVFARPFAASEAQQTRVEVADMAPPEGTIYVYRMQFWNGRGHTGDTRTFYDEETGEIEGSVVRVPDEPLGEFFGGPMLLHELGHVLGLTHDDQGPSIMSPKIVRYNPHHFSLKAATRLEVAAPLAPLPAVSTQYLTDSDIALLRRWYRTY